jgi:hypothetical protein
VDELITTSSTLCGRATKERRETAGVLLGVSACALTVSNVDASSGVRVPHHLDSTGALHDDRTNAAADVRLVLLECSGECTSNESLAA